MTNKSFQDTVNQYKSIIPRRFGVLDENGVVIACSDVAGISQVWDGVISKVFKAQAAVVDNEVTFKKIGTPGKIMYAIFCDGGDEHAQAYCELLTVPISNLPQVDEEGYNKESFIKNLLTDNILSGDIYVKAKDLKMFSDACRVVFLVRVQDTEYIARDVVEGMFPNKNKDIVLGINEYDIALVKEVSEKVTEAELHKIALKIVGTVEAELITKVKVGIGSVCMGITEVAHSYKDAQVALEVGKVFDTEHSIISYNGLGIGRLIYQLPTKLCELFLKEVFKSGAIDSLDDETIVTIQKFFENNLNVSEASRQLYVHRNTLVYRLDKIYRITGLDLRSFDDAIVFKIAMMVNKYLKSDSIRI